MKNNSSRNSIHIRYGWKKQIKNEAKKQEGAQLVAELMYLLVADCRNACLLKNKMNGEAGLIQQTRKHKSIGVRSLARVQRCR